MNQKRLNAQNLRLQNCIICKQETESFNFSVNHLKWNNCYVIASSTKDGSNHHKKSIDGFKKFARLGTSLLISDAFISISATMRGKRTPDDLAKLIYRFKDANPNYANSAIARIFSISKSTLRGILKRCIGQKKVKLGRKFVLTKRIKRQLLGRCNRNSKLRLSDLLLTARRLVSNATAHRCLKNCAIRNSVAVEDVLTNAQKDRRVNWCRRHSFFDFTKGISSDD